MPKLEVEWNGSWFIPCDVLNENLESKVLEVFSKASCEILSRDVEGCHRLTNNDRDIVIFLRRKDCDQVLPVKWDLREVKLEDIGSRGSNSIFINPSLCPYYRMLWSKSKRLLDLGKINNFYVSSGKIKIRIQENSKPMSINHFEDFKKYFPDVDLTPSSWRKLLISSYLISISARCCVTTMYSYYGVVQGFISWLCWNLPVYFQLQSIWLESLSSLFIKPVYIICSTLYVIIGFLQFVSIY